jgi:putative tryptophan/tyrosine transport system substrate-binding protein
MTCIGRREFTILLGGAAMWPLAARAQQAGKVHRIGFLGSATAAGSAKALESLRMGLREFGYVEGTNIGIEFRWAEGIYDRLPYPRNAGHARGQAGDHHNSHRDGNQRRRYCNRSRLKPRKTRGQPHGIDFLSSTTQCEATGTAQGGVSAHLPSGRALQSRQSCQQTDHSSDAGSRRVLEFDSRNLAFATMAKSRVDSVVVTEDGEFAASFRAIATLALANKLPSIGATEYAEAGGLIGYGVNILGLYRRTAYFVDRILKRS